MKSQNNNVIQLAVGSNQQPQETYIDYESMPDYVGQNEVVHLKEEVPNTTSNQQPAKSIFKLTHCFELMSREYKENWLIKGFFQYNSLNLIFGNSASGKSLIIQDACYCIGNGIDFMGKATKQGNVVYIAGEGFSGLHKRFKALAKHYGQDVNNIFFSEQPAALMDVENAASVRDSIIKSGGAALIVIDTFHRNMGGGDENSAKDFGQFLNNIDVFLKPLGAAIIIIHHSGHDDKERSRGSSSIRAAMDTEYQVSKDDDNVTIKNTKMKDSTPPLPMAFTMKQVDVDLVDDDGEQVTSVVLESSEYVPRGAKKSKPLSSNNQHVLTSLRSAIKTNGIEPTQDIKNLFTDSPHLIPKSVVNIEYARDGAYKAITIDGNTLDAKRKAFARGIKAIEKTRHIGLFGDYAWIIDI